MIADGDHPLTVSARIFAGQLNDVAVHIAEQDYDTVLSVLRNHGRRVGAARMLLISLEGDVAVGTATHPLSG